MDKYITAAIGLVTLVWIISRLKPDLLPPSFSAVLPAGMR